MATDIRNFVIKDTKGRPLALQRWFETFHFWQVLEVPSGEWDVAMTDDRDSFKVAVAEGRVQEIDETTAALVGLDLIGGAMR